MKLLLDMNLSPTWVDVLSAEGWIAVHWSTVGDPRAADTVIMEYARMHNFVVFTHDLDFGTLLALTHADSPSVIQVRSQDILPAHLQYRIIHVLHQYGEWLEKGALLTVDEDKARIRILPF